MPISNPVAFPLFPIVEGRCGCGDPECKRAGKHPAVAWAGLERGSPVPLPAPGAGYGLKTGAGPKGSGVVVVDLDGPDAVDAWLALGGGPDTYTVRTPRGLHFYFRHPGFEVRPSAGIIGKGIDFRGDGGFVVGPDSPHVSGETYELALDMDPAPMPDWLLAWFRSRPVSTPAGVEVGDVTDPDERARRREIYAKYLRDEAPARGPERRGRGDATLYEVVQRGAYDLALPTDDVLELVREHYDPRCSPQWGNELEERVRHKARDAKTKSTRPRREPVAAGLEAIFEGRPWMAESVPAPATRKRLTASERAKRVGGAKIRLTTGMPTLDAATRGGLPLGKVVVFGGAPGASKTGLLVQLAYRWLCNGVAVALFCADEDADAILIRLGQLAGLERDRLEGGDEGERAALARWCDGVPLLLVDGDESETVEAVSRELRDFASGRASVFLIDSIQTARTAEQPPRGSDMRARINVVVRVLKASAKVDGHLVIATSEISKAAYRNRDQAENVSALSAFKESGDIEYGVGLAMVLVNEADTSDVVRAEIAKNRFGARCVFHLRLDPARAGVLEASAANLPIDPTASIKSDVLRELARARRPLTRNRVYERVGGRKTTVFRTIDAMLEEKIIIEDLAAKGLRLPLPGEAGYVAAAS